LRWQDKKWFPFNPEQLSRAQRQFQRFGLVSLLFAWVPVIGDPLTFFAGVMRIRFWQFLVLVAIGKSLRYGVLIWLALQAL
jgi:membrane protein YqaA with SNARE-associated domain